jgi:hypothetical protein
MRLLFSTRLMFAALALLTLGCTLRVSCEALAYQGFAAWAWSVLPVSAVIELAAVGAFAANLLATFIRKPRIVAMGIEAVRSSWNLAFSPERIISVAVTVQGLSAKC